MSEYQQIVFRCETSTRRIVGYHRTKERAIRAFLDTYDERDEELPDSFDLIGYVKNDCYFVAVGGELIVTNDYLCEGFEDGDEI
jgi:hypothetical protein